MKEAGLVQLPLHHRRLLAQPHQTRFAYPFWEQQRQGWTVQSHRHSPTLSWQSEVLVLTEVSRYRSHTSASASLCEACNSMTSPLFNSSWRVHSKSAEEESTKTPSGPQCIVKMENPWESRCTEMWVWFNNHCVMLFSPFSHQKAVVLRKCLPASLLKNSWFCSVFIWNTQC